MERVYVNALDTETAYAFMVGYIKLKSIDQKIIMFLHEREYHYNGTYTQLCHDMGFQDSYSSEINRACKRLESYGILSIKAPTVWYFRDLYLVEDWTAKVIALGKENANDNVLEEEVHRNT